MNMKTYLVQLMDFPERIITAKSPGAAKSQYLREAVLDQLSAARWNVELANKIPGLTARKLKGTYI